MGERHAVSVASAATQCILDFKHQCKTHASIIDSARFTGPREAVIADAKTYCERARRAGATINEDTSDIEALVKTEGDFNGEHYDFTNKTCCLTQKTIDKLRATYGRIETWTWRQYAAHMGLLFYAVPTLEVKVVKYFDAMRFFRNAYSFLSTNIGAWDFPMQKMPKSAKDQLIDWTEFTLTNEPRKIIRPNKKITHTVITDASGSGWGALCMRHSDGSILTKSGVWPTRDLAEMSLSTRSEPRAVWLALASFFNCYEKAVVELYTDHLPFVYALQRSYSSSYYNNHELDKISSTFRGLTIIPVHIPGEFNVVDALSRGEVGRTISEGALKWFADRGHGKDEPILRYYASLPG
jgi:hypothetical protein